MPLVTGQVAHNYASGGSPSVTLPNPTTAGNFLIAHLHLNGTTVPSAPAGWTLATSHVNGSTCLSAMYYQENIAGGNTTFSFTTSAHACDLIIAEWSGVATSASIDQTGSGATFSNHVSAQSKTTTSANEVWFFGFGSQNNHTISGVTSGYTLVDSVTGASGSAWLYSQEVTSTGTAAPAATLNSSDNWDSCQATFIETSGGGSIVAGSAAEVSNAALVEASALINAPATLEADSALVESAAQVLSPAPVQANAVLSETSATLIATGDTLQANSALGEAAQIVASGDTLASNSALSVVGQVIANGAALVAQTALSEASALIIATGLTEQSNSALVATGGIAGATVHGSATIQANAALVASGQVIGNAATMQSNAALNESAAQVLVAPQVQANSALSEASARLIVATPQAIQSNAALSEAAVLIAAALTLMQANSVLAATGASVAPSGPGSVALADAYLGTVTLSDMLLPGSVALSDAALGTVALSDLVAELVGV